MKFVDEVRVDVAAGDGGNGCVAFLREKYRPYGGPAGGSGGRGGNVFAEVDPGLTTLLDLGHRRSFRAERGSDGGGKNKDGAAGGHCALRVPVGTLITDARTGELVVDLTTTSQRAVLAEGGRGGAGNALFATATDQAPRRADQGQPGRSRELKLELRLIAEAGLVGLPNAGKSSLLSRLSAARPKVAEYPFTTLAPVLGAVRVAEDRSFIIADIPGLIEGAHRGRGLGLSFLRHLSRTSLLVHLVDCSQRCAEEALADFETVNGELSHYTSELAGKPQIVVASKADLPEVGNRLSALRSLFAARNIDVLAVSAATGAGCKELVSAVHARLRGPGSG